MTLPASYTPEVLTTNGTTTDFTFNFPALSTTYIKVYSQDLTTGALTEITTGITITENSTKTGGTVVFSTAPDDCNIVIARDTPQSQLVPLSTSTGFPAKVLEAMFDKIVAMVQERFEELERSLSYPQGTDSGVSSEIPAPQAGKSLKGNATSDGWVVTTYDPDEQVILATAQAGTATTQAGLAAAARIGAETAKDKAEEWAEKAEDSEVETDKYSALHWAAKAEEYAASLNLPILSGSSEDDIITVNSAKDGYDFTGKSSQEEAEAGTEANKYMTPLRTAQAITALGTPAPSLALVAYAHFNGSGASIVINKSKNVGSITDNGAGDYTINFTNNMKDTYYIVTGTAQRDDVANANVGVTIKSAPGAQAVDSVTILLNNSAGTAVDCNRVCVAIFGELA